MSCNSDSIASNFRENRDDSSQYKIIEVLQNFPKVDEASFAELLKQVRDHEFE